MTKEQLQSLYKSKIIEIIKTSNSDVFTCYEVDESIDAIELNSSSVIVHFYEPSITSQNESQFRLYGYYCYSNDDKSMHFAYELQVINSNERYFRKDVYELSVKIAEVIEEYFSKLNTSGWK